MSFQKKIAWFFLSIAVGVAVTIYVMSSLVIHPGNCVGDLGGDSIKNIFTYLYHSMYGTGYWFMGMNYPYGEHIVFTDAIPILSVLLASPFINNVYPATALTVLWWLIGVSYVLEIVFLYLVLIKFSLKPVIAIFFSVLIGIYTPQLFALQGHFSLAFTCMIPMLFYWTIQYHRNFKLKYPIYIFILGCISVFIHPYYSAMLLFWAIFYSIGYFIFVKADFLIKLKRTFPLLISTFAVFLLFGMIMKMTDPVTDRPLVPHGMLDNRTGGRQIFTSNHSPVWSFLKETKIVGHITEGGEGYTYIGIVALLVVGFSLVFGLIKIAKNQKGNLVIAESLFSPVWLFMACAILLLSMGVPFIWHSMEWLLKYLSVFRQFRAIGRFSWMYYYLITVYAAVVINTWFNKLILKRRVIAAYSLMCLSIITWSYEAISYTGFARSIASSGKANYDFLFSNREENWVSFLESHNFKKDNFQGIILIGMIHIGTEKFWIGEDKFHLLTMGIRSSLQLCLPMVDVVMSRSSWSQAKDQVKIAAGPFAEKPLLHNIKSEKPFLLLTEESDSLNDDERYLFRAGDFVGNFSSCKVYAYYPMQQLTNEKVLKDSINKIIAYIKNSDTCIGAKENLYIDHFDRGTSSPHLFGTGALQYTQSPDSLVTSISINFVQTGDSQQYEFSTWFLLEKNDFTSPSAMLYFADSAEKIIRVLEVPASKSLDHNGMWSRASRYFYIPHNCKKIICRVINQSQTTYIAMDELMLRPAKALVISKAIDGKVMVDNHIFLN